MNAETAKVPLGSVPAPVIRGADDSAKARGKQLNQPQNFLNRELSFLQFNSRVLYQAESSRRRILERLKFISIFSSNMDEFYEIRVAALMKQISYGREIVGDDGLAPIDALKEISFLAHGSVERQYQIFNEEILPALAAERIEILRRNHWSEQQSTWLWDFFMTEVMPVVSPIGLDPAHPFPRLVNKSLNFIVRLEGKDAFGRDSGLAIVPVPVSLPKILKMPSEISNGIDAYVFVSSIIHSFLGELFPGMTVDDAFQFRITRNADFEVNDEDVDDIARAVMGELHSRKFGSAVRLEVSRECHDDLVEFLLREFNLSANELFKVDGPVYLARVWEIYDLLDRSDLKDDRFIPGMPIDLKNMDNLFDAIRHKDILLHHPYQSISPVVRLIRQAARDPDVVAIKQTLYRIGSNSEMAESLMEAARNGKTVTVIIELRARFDEAENINFAARLQEAGALVIYGIVAYKTHAKMLLIVRRENDKLIRYAHLGTGNYHTANARQYTDYGLLTSDPELCLEVHNVFQQLTGMGKTFKIHRILHAPFTLKKGLIAMINGEKAAALEGKSARIIGKVNGLTDAKVITALYEASQAGVKIDLIVRSMCCLRPGLAGLSENIRVISVVGRFLEHSRVYYFENNSTQVYLSSADWMERNLSRRVEVCFPVDAPKLAQRVIKDLEQLLVDKVDAWELCVDGKYQKIDAMGRDGSAQQELLKRYAQSQLSYRED